MASARRWLWLTPLLAVSMLIALAGCGDGETQAGGDAGQGDSVSSDDSAPVPSDDSAPVPSDDSAPVQSQPPANDSDTTPDAEDGDLDSGDSTYQLTKSQPDLMTAKGAPIDEIVVVDENTIGVRYTSGSEPCSRSVVQVTETDGTITVLLQTGLHPNAAAMSCVAAQIGYEIRVPLDSPIGDRQIIAGDPIEG